MSNQIVAIVLAAGKGSRMKSETPKVLHHLHHKPMVEYVLENLKKSSAQKTVLVIGRDSKPFAKLLQRHPDVVVCTQNQPRGTGDAVASTATIFAGAKLPAYMDSSTNGTTLESEYVLVCTGDLPTFTPKMLDSFISETISKNIDLSVLGFNPDINTGYGRLITGGKNHELTKIVEERDCTFQERKVRLCNSGIIIAKTKALFELLARIDSNNEQGEYYLTDCIKLAADSEHMQVGWSLGEPWQNLMGINTPDQLLKVEEYLTKNT